MYVKHALLFSWSWLSMPRSISMSSRIHTEYVTKPRFSRLPPQAPNSWERYWWEGKKFLWVPASPEDGHTCPQKPIWTSLANPVILIGSWWGFRKGKIPRRSPDMQFLLGVTKGGPWKECHVASSLAHSLCFDFIFPFALAFPSSPDTCGLWPAPTCLTTTKRSEAQGWLNTWICYRIHNAGKGFYQEGREGKQNKDIRGGIVGLHGQTLA